MKHIFFNVLCMLLVSFCVNCSAECCSSCAEIHFIDCPKTYVHPRQIDFFDNGIFVRINDCILQTEKIGTDAEGIFFSNVRNIDCGPLQWLCRNPDSRGMTCDTCNWDWNYSCYVCGKEKK